MKLFEESILPKKTHRFVPMHNCIINGVRIRSREYNSFKSMLNRCYRSSDPMYHLYGNRNIRVCERWVLSFNNFLEDMGERPKGKTLDRINNNGNYEPDNCRWATPLQQSLSRRGDSDSELGLKGVHRSRKKYRACLSINGKTIVLGRYNTKEEAKIAYDAAMKLYIEIVDTYLTPKEALELGLVDEVV